MTDLSNELRAALDRFITAHHVAAGAFQYHAELDTDLKAARLHIMEEIAGELDHGKPKYSNAEKREAELQRRLAAQHADLLRMYEAATISKRETAAECERQLETLKTLRALLMHASSETELQAARIRAETAVTTTADDEEDYPF